MLGIKDGGVKNAETLSSGLMTKCELIGIPKKTAGEGRSTANFLKCFLRMCRGVEVKCVGWWTREVDVLLD